MSKVSTNFIARCYNVASDACTLSEIRQRVWSNRVGKTSSCAAKLASLPPTTESFVENTSRVHFKTCVWKHAIDQDPPNTDPCDYG